MAVLGVFRQRQNDADPVPDDIDRDALGSKRSRTVNVIDSKRSEHDAGAKPLRTFAHHALKHDAEKRKPLFGRHHALTL